MRSCFWLWRPKKHKSNYYPQFHKSDSISKFAVISDHFWLRDWYRAAKQHILHFDWELFLYRTTRMCMSVSLCFRSDDEWKWMWIKQQVLYKWAMKVELIIIFPFCYTFIWNANFVCIILFIRCLNIRILCKEKGAKEN